jgi:hypothetical protein
MVVGEGTNVLQSQVVGERILETSSFLAFYGGITM